MFKKFLLLSFRNIKHRELRSWLTILGIIIGIALISSIVSLGKGLEETILQQLRKFGSDLIYVFPGEESQPFLGILGGGSLREKEVRAIENIPGTRMVVPFDVEFVTAEFQGEQKSTLIHGSPIDKSKILYTESRGLGMDKGRWPEKEGSSELVLGYKIANTLFKEPIHIGDQIRIKGKEFRISRILNEFLSCICTDNAIKSNNKNMSCYCSSININSIKNINSFSSGFHNSPGRLN